MGWADREVEGLAGGQTVSFRPRGNSMSPRVESGALVTCEPVLLEQLEVDDIVLCRVRGRVYLHLVTAVGSDGRVQIGNNKGRINGWTRTVYGRAVAVD